MLWQIGDAARPTIDSSSSASSTRFSETRLIAAQSLMTSGTSFQFGAAALFGGIEYALTSFSIRCQLFRHQRGFSYLGQGRHFSLRLAVRAGTAVAWGAIMSRAYAHSGYSFARRQSAPEPIAQPSRRPFSKPITHAQTCVVLPFKSVKNSPYSTGLKPEAIDKLPPMDPARLISRPEPAMSDAAKRLFMLKWWLEECFKDRRLDAEVYPTECRLREQASHIIGYLV